MRKGNLPTPDSRLVLQRRDFIHAATAAGLAVGFMPWDARQGLAADDITYFTWSGYEVPDLHRDYINRYGASPEFTFFGDEEEALQKMRAGFRPDVAHPCSYIVSRWHDADLLEPIDTSRVDAWNDVFDGLKNIPGTVLNGQRWWVPTDWGYNSIAYRTDLIDIAPEDESWGILFDEAYKGRISMRDAMDLLVFAAGAVAGIDDIYHMTPEEEQEVRELLVKQKKLLRFYWTDPTEIEQALASGEVVAAFAWTASATSLIREGVPIGYMSPKEGVQTWVCGLAKIKGGEGPDDRAYDFINAWLSPESGRFIIEQYGYGHANKAAFDMVDPVLLTELGLEDADSLFKHTHFMDVFDPATRERLIKMVDEILASS